MKIIYLPNFGFEIDSIKFDWNENRKIVRQKIRNQHKDDDKIIEMAAFFGGDKNRNIEQRRDIYENINNNKNHFFLNYDEHDNLKELEIHSGIEISIREVILEFQKDISNYLKKLILIGENYSEIEEGNYLFENLKMTIANSESLGGEGNGLEYFYSAKNIEHLIEE